MDLTDREQKLLTRSSRRVNVMLCTGIASLVVAVLVVPVYYIQIGAVKANWESAYRLAESGIVPQTSGEMQLQATLLESLEELKKAWVVGLMNKAMEIVGVLLAVGALLVWFSRRESVYRSLIGKLNPPASPGTQHAASQAP